MTVGFDDTDTDRILELQEALQRLIKTLKENVVVDDVVSDEIQRAEEALGWRVD